MNPVHPLQPVSLRQFCERFDLRTPGGRLDLRAGRVEIVGYEHKRVAGEWMTTEAALLKGWAQDLMPAAVRHERLVNRATLDPMLQLAADAAVQLLCDGLASRALQFDPATGIWTVRKLAFAPVAEPKEAA